jgi:hypothetical protein
VQESEDLDDDAELRESAIQVHFVLPDDRSEAFCEALESPPKEAKRCREPFFLTVGTARRKTKEQKVVGTEWQFPWP